MSGVRLTRRIQSKNLESIILLPDGLVTLVTGGKIRLVHKIYQLSVLVRHLHGNVLLSYDQILNIPGKVSLIKFNLVLAVPI